MAHSLTRALESTWTAMPDLPESRSFAEEVYGHREKGRLGAYESIRKLGEGEFASVYECTRVGFEGSFAVKAIEKTKVQRHASLLKSKRNIRRVNAEVAAMKRCAHQGVCQLFDVMQSPSRIYLVMEMGERDLFSFLDEYPDGCSEVILKRIGRIMALALRHCHSRGIAHRDIKPENVLICGLPHQWGTDDDNVSIVKLCDFGLCASLLDGQKLTDFVGSPGFFAPELMTRRQYDGALADMWSLGAVLVEMLLGHKTFDDLWCPPYEYLHDVSAFAASVKIAVDRVLRIELISDPVRKLLSQLLQIEPELRADVEQICTAPWFDLLKFDSKTGASSVVRLTLDRDRPSFSDDDAIFSEKDDESSPFPRRVAYRETPETANTLMHSPTKPSMPTQPLSARITTFGGGAGPGNPTSPPPPPFLAALALPRIV